LGLIQAQLLIEALNAQRGRWPRSSERWMFKAHARVNVVCNRGSIVAARFAAKSA
jgi:hypothetical protein